MKDDFYGRTNRLFASLPIYLRVLITAALIAGFALASGALIPPKASSEALNEAFPGASRYFDHMARTGLDVTVSLIMEDKEPLSKEGLQAVFSLTKALAETPKLGVKHVRSLSNIPRMQLDENGEMVASPLVLKVFSSEVERRQLAKDILADENAVGAVVSKDLTLYMFALGLAKDADFSKIKQLVDKSSGGFKVYAVGAPAKNLIVENLKQDAEKIGSLLGGFALLIFAIWIFAFHSGVLLGLLTGFIPFASMTGVWVLTCLPQNVLSLTALPAAMAVFAAVACALSSGSRTVPAALLSASLSMIASAVLLLVLPHVALDAPASAVMNAGLIALAFVPLAGAFAGKNVVMPAVTAASRPIFSLKKIAAIALGIAGISLISGVDFKSSPEGLLKDEKGRQAYALLDAHTGGHAFTHFVIESDETAESGALAAGLFVHDVFAEDADVADVRSASEIISSLGDKLGAGNYAPMSVQSLNAVKFYLDGMPDFEMLASQQNEKIKMVQVLVKPKAGKEGKVASKAEELKARLEKAAEKFGAAGIMREHFIALIGAKENSAPAMPKYAECYKQIGGEFDWSEGVVRLIIELEKPSMPLAFPHQTQEMSLKLRALFELEETELRQKTENLLKTVKGFAELEPETAAGYVDLTAHTIKEIKRDVCAEGEASKLAPALKAKDAKKFKRLKSLIIASWAPAAGGGTGGKPPRMSVLGLPSVESAAETAQMINVSYSAAIILVLFLLGLSFDGVFANVGLFGLLVVSAFVWSKLGRPFSPLSVYAFVAFAAGFSFTRLLKDDPRAALSFILLCAMLGALFISMYFLLPVAPSYLLFCAAALIAIPPAAKLLG